MQEAKLGKPAARISDMHSCPMANPGPVPHVGGPIMGPGCATVLIGGLPAAVLGDNMVCAGAPDSGVVGSVGVLIGGKPALRMGDSTAHGGVIVGGFPTVLIGETGGGGVGGTASTGRNSSSQGASPAPASASSAASGPLAPRSGSAQGNRAANNGTRSQESESTDNDSDHWITIQLIDDDGAPIPDQPFKVTFQSGKTLSGRSDVNGYAEFEGLDQDTGEVEFLEIPQEENHLEDGPPARVRSR